MKFPKPTRVTDEAYKQWIREQPCIVCGSPPPSDPHHVKSRGAGGGDDQMVPTCRICHTTGGTIGWKTFEAKYGVNLRSEALKLREWYLPIGKAIKSHHWG